jgi:sulfate permease, SulP family
MGSSQYQVSGPAAALSVMVLALATKFADPNVAGSGAVAVAAVTIFIGIVELVLMFALAGRAMKFVPESVLAGFTSGVGLKILDQQVPELLGFPETVDWGDGNPNSLVDVFSMMHKPHWLRDVSWHAVVCGIFVIFVVTSMRQFKRFPAAIVAIGLVTFVAVYLNWNEANVATGRAGLETVAAVGKGRPLVFSPFSIPRVKDELWLDLFIATLPLAILAAAESLISASAIDRMANAKKKHLANAELGGQGIANLFSGLFGGMPVTGVVARSGVNVQSGARTRISTMSHAVILAVSVVFLGKYIGQVPLAALAGLLCVIGFRLIELGTLVHLYKEHKLEALAFVVTLAGTVSGRLMTGLVAGLCIHFFNHWLTRHERAQIAEVAANKKQGIRAILAKEKAEARRPAHFEHLPSEYRKWLGQIREEPLVAKGAYIHPAATVIGRVVIGDRAHIAADTSVRADEGSPFHIGPNTNIQDGVIMHALKDKRVMVAGEPWAIYVGKNVSMAHGALVHGPSYIGDDTFIGFKAIVHDSVVGAHCFIGHGAIVVGVEIPEGRFVPAGRIVDSADAVDALPPVSHAHQEFTEDVVEVNRGLAVAYHQADDRRNAAVAAELTDETRMARIWEADWAPLLPKERF